MVDKNELSRLWERAHEENIKNREAISKFIQDRTDKKLIVRSTCSYYTKSMEVSVNIEFFDEAKGKTDFGSDFDIYYRSYHRDESPKLQMGCGTIGSYTRDDAPYQIDRMRLMLKLWDCEEELVSLFNHLPHFANDEAEALQRQADKEEEEAERLAEENKRLKVIRKLQVGYKFSDSSKRLGNHYEYTVTKITPKRVYLDYTTSGEVYYPVYDEARVYTGTQCVLRHEKRSGYINYDWLVQDLMELGNEGTLPVAAGIKGISYLSVETENLEFRPCE